MLPLKKKKEFIYLFLERGERREKERERNIDVPEKWLPLSSPQPGTWPSTQAYALTGNRTCDVLVCRTMPNPLSHPLVRAILPFFFFSRESRHSGF